MGAGLAGGVVAAQLAEEGFAVTLVEQGEAAAPLVPGDERWVGSDLKAVFTRGQGIGGSSNFWHGGLIILDRSDIEAHAPGDSTSKFPISFDELCGYYRSALTLMTNGAVSLEDLLPTGTKEPSFRVDDSTFALKPMYFQHAPFSTAGLVERAQREWALKVEAGFSVETVTFGDGGRVVAVEGSRSGQEAKARIEADIFVLCAGGIGSPRIMLRAARSEPGLRDLPIGKFLIDHPTGFTFKAKLRARRNLKRLFGSTDGLSGGLRRRLGMILRDTHLGVADGRNHVVYLRPAFTMRDPQEFNELKSRLVAHRGRQIRIGDVLRLLSHPDLFGEALNFRFGLFTSVRHVAGFVFAEQLPSSDNRITLGPDGRYDINWSIAPEDSESLRAFLDAFVRHHDDVFENVVFFPDLLGSGAHHSGGCRMAGDRSRGVVGRDMKVFGTSNLFVADGSVLGYSGHANTGLTIVALALKCVEEVKSLR